MCTRFWSCLFRIGCNWRMVCLHNSTWSVLSGTEGSLEGKAEVSQFSGGTPPTSMGESLRMKEKFSVWVVPHRAGMSRQGLPVPHQGDAALQWWSCHAPLEQPHSLGKSLHRLLAFPGGSLLNPQMPCENTLARCLWKRMCRWQQEQNRPRVSDAVTSSFCLQSPAWKHFGTDWMGSVPRATRCLRKLGASES